MTDNTGNMGEGTNQGYNQTGTKPDIDTSLGLGAAANADNGSAPTIGEQMKDNQAIYDSYGNFTYPFNTASRYIDRQYLEFHAYFYTQKDEYDAFWVVGRNDTPKSERYGTEHEFDQELAGFHTDNQNKGIPTMQIYLFAYRDWEQILRPNDYVALRVFEKYPDDPNEVYGNKGDMNTYKEDMNGVRHRTLMVGLISNISITEDATSSAKLYTITCQGMQKVLSNITLGLPKEAQWNDVNLLFDINGASNPANESFPTYGNGSSSNSKSSGNSNGPSKETGSGVMQGIIAWCNSRGYSVNQTAGVLASAQVESGEGHNLSGPDINGNNLLGYSPGSNTVGTGNSLPHNKSGAYKYCQMFWSHVEGPKQYDSNSKGKSAYACGTLFCAECDRPDGNTSTSSPQAKQRGTLAEGYAKELK